MDKILAKLEVQLQELLTSFVAKPCSDWGDYKQRLGHALGLQEALETLEEQKRQDEEYISRD